MQVNVQITSSELADMDATVDQLKQGIVECLDGGINIEYAGTVYLAGFNVVVQVTD